MYITSLNSIKTQSFGSAIQYKGRYIPDKYDQTVDIIRAHFEEKLGPLFFYQDQINKETSQKYKKTAKTDIIIEKAQKGENKVDVNMLKDLKFQSLKEVRQNELYSGGNLAYNPEKLKTLKEAGINSVLCLVNYPDYKKNAEEAGLNFIELGKINDSGLNIFDINGDLLKTLINHPESYCETKSDSKIAALKEFIKILNGENEKYPLPLYFGCQNGTDRTYMWTQLYKILKDEDMTKPLSKEAVNTLAEFRVDLEDYFRW